MAVEVAEKNGGKMLHVRVTDKLTKEDYDHFVPEVERRIKQHGKVRVLFEMNDFHGWKAGALWEDLKFDVKHFKDIERLGMIGETKWQEGMSKFCSPFTAAEIKYFTPSQREEAEAWVSQN